MPFNIAILSQELEMERKIYQSILDWKNQSGGKSALLIDGARRVGKSYIVREFAKSEYKSHIILDFNNPKPEVIELFERYLHDLPKFFNYLSALEGVTLYKRNSVIVFDEVQQYPRARAAIKYLVEEGSYDYIETGSLISIKKNVKDIVIPSEEEHINMYPMDFEEFLWAVGDRLLADRIRESYSAREGMGLLHRKSMERLREYMLIGGMPQAVQAFVDGESFTRIDRIKKNILDLYVSDISKYADGQELRVREIFEEIPSQLNRHEKKFRLADLSSSARMRDYDSAFFWLADSMVVNIAYNSTEPNVGLRLNLDRTTLKCYMGDTGLLLTLANEDRIGGEEDLYRKIIAGKLEVNYGMVIENLVAQMLRASGNRLYFFSSYSKDNSADRMEIDFLIREKSITSRRNISPIEVKSTTRFSIKSLEKFITKYSNYVGNPMVVYPGELKSENGISFIPLYMVPFI